MNNIVDDLRKSYEKTCLEGEVYLWQIYIIEHPNENTKCYKESIKSNLDKLKNLE